MDRRYVPVGNDESGKGIIRNQDIALHTAWAFPFSYPVTPFSDRTAGN